MWTLMDRPTARTDLEYAESVRFVGVHTGRDADTGPVGDDLLGNGLSFIVLISDGRTCTSRTRSLTFPPVDLDTAIAGYTDREIRAIVTLTR